MAKQHQVPYSNGSRLKIGVSSIGYQNSRPVPSWLTFFFINFVVFHQDQVIRRVNNLIHQLNGPSGYQLTRRPFRINWFINQLAMYVFPEPVCHYHLINECFFFFTDVWYCGVMIQISMMRWNLLNQFLFQLMSWMHYGLVLVGLITRRSKHFPQYRHLLSVIQQKCDSLRQQLVEACTSTNVDLPFPPSYSVPSFLRSWYCIFLCVCCFGQHLPLGYRTNTYFFDFDFCYLPFFFCCSAYATIRFVFCLISSCINNFGRYIQIYFRRMSFISLLFFFFFSFPFPSFFFFWFPF